MRRQSAPLSEDLPALARLGAIFVGIGILTGLLRGDGALIGGLAGLMLFGLFFSVGWLLARISRD